MGEIFRAPEEDWAAVERESAGYSSMLCICELRDRVAVLEARERDFSTVRNETGQYLRAGTPVYADPRNPLFSYSVGEARPLEECGKDHAVPTSAPAEPNDPAAPGFFPVEYADADGEGIRILMEPADETGRACWVVRNSRHVNPCREFPTPEAAYAAHRDAAHAQQQATVKESLTAEPAPADPEDREWITDRCPAPSETNFYGWVEVPASCRSSQPITEDGRRYTEYYLIDKGDPWLPASADYYNSRRALFDSGYKKGLEAGRAERRQEAATEESSAAHSEPANPDAPAPTEPAPPAPAGGLVEEIMRKVPGSKEEEIKWTLGVVAEWLKGRQPSHEIELDSIDFAAFLLRMEAIR